MKRFGIIVTIFLVFAYLVVSIPEITNFDIKIIHIIQSFLGNISASIGDFIGTKMYYSMIAIPIVVGSVYFIYKKMYKNIIILCISPIVAYMLNTVIKIIVQRPRPPFDLHLVYHPHSFSFISRHTFVTTCLWGLVIYFANTYCKNIVLKNIIVLISVCWIFIIGFSRVWIGVHYPTDVIGAYILGTAFAVLFAFITTKLNKD